MNENINGSAQDMDVRRQQLELLESVTEYAPKAISELKKLSAEYYGVKQEDSDEYLDFVLENSNWMLEALNATIDLINEETQMIDRGQANQAVLDLNDALASKVDARIADALEKGLIPLLENYMIAAQNLTEK